MKKLLILSFLFSSFIALNAQTEININNGFFTDVNGSAFNGSYETYYLGGQIESIYEINDGVKDGHLSVFHMNGSLKETGKFNSGLKHGEWTAYNESG